MFPMGLRPGHTPGDERRWGRGSILRLLAIAALGAGILAASPAIGGSLVPNPANDQRLLRKPIDAEEYDRADGCRKGVPRGMRELERWLERNVRGESWGITRCERLRPGASTAARLGYASRDGNFSVHSEGRAIDWRLDAGVAKERRAAMRLIRTLLATDREGNQRALARRMGIQGLIFDCRSWWAGMEDLGEYSYCYRRNGELRRNLDRTQAHRDHVHIELNWAGARERTSFWRSPLAR
jgi:hypothetical protein